MKNFSIILLCSTLNLALVTFNLSAQTPGALDATFNTTSGANAGISATAIQSDGKIIIAGSFTTFNGITANLIARLNTDGSLDGTFNPFGAGVAPTTGTAVSAIAIQSDGKIIIGGNFTSYNGTTTSRIARLNTDGSLDVNFNPGGAGANGPGANVAAIVIQSDGKIIIGGGFTSYNTIAIRRIARLNTDGTLDQTSFLTPTTVTVGNVTAIAIQSDGKIIFTGSTQYDGIGINKIARLNTDGTLDAPFTTGVGAGPTGGSSLISSISIQSNGRIIIGGNFTTFNTVPIGDGVSGHITRLNTDGTLDGTFNLGGAGAFSSVRTTAIQSDGKIIIGGLFNKYNLIFINRIARLNTDGTLDSAFTFYAGGSLVDDPTHGANSTINKIAIQSDGGIIIGGGAGFTSYNGTAVNRLARILGDCTPFVTTANASATTVFAGTSVTLTGGGGVSYTWTGGVTNGISFVPTSTQTYTVTGTTGGACFSTDSITVTVNKYGLTPNGEFTGTSINFLNKNGGITGSPKLSKSGAVF